MIRILDEYRIPEGIRFFQPGHGEDQSNIPAPRDYLSSYQNFREPQMMYLFPLYSSVQTVPNSAFQFFFNVQC